MSLLLWMKNILIQLLARMGMNMDQSRTTNPNITVQAAVNSQGTNIKATGINNENVQNQTFHIGGPRNGATCEIESVDGCRKPMIKTAVPAEDGLTLIEVFCEEGQGKRWRYTANIESNWPFRSDWTFRGVPVDTMLISGKWSKGLFNMTSELETEYRSKLREASDGCLHLQFLHETEEEAKRMCEDKDFVKERFLHYMAGVGKDATSCTVEASYTHVASSPKQAEHIPNKDSYATSESGDAKGIGGTTFDDDSSSENSDESFFSMDGSETFEVRCTRCLSTSAEEESENEDTSTQIGATQLASCSKRAEMESMLFEGHAPRSRIVVTNKESMLFEVHAPRSRILVTDEGSMLFEGHAPHSRILVTDEDLFCRHCHKFRRGRLCVNIAVESLKNLAHSALRLHPLPAEVIKKYGCDTCDNVTKEAKHELGKHVFFIHLFDQSEITRCTCELMQKTQYHMKKILSALRNTHGGILYVHSSHGIEDTRSFVESILSTLTSPGEIDSDVFECEFDKTDPDILRIDVEASATFITADLKTKQPASLMLKYKSVSLDTLKLRLFPQSTGQKTAPTLQGVSYIKNGKAVVKLYANVERWSYDHRSLSDKVSELVDEVHLSEHVSSLSKRKKGGNIFVGEKQFCMEDMEGFNIVPPGKWQVDELKRTLEQELLSRIFVFENKYSDVNDVFTIGLHNTGDDEYIIEVAVRPVNACVFHDALGPMSFELEERKIAGLKHDVCVRLSFDDWLKKMFPEMKIGNTEHK